MVARLHAADPGGQRGADHGGVRRQVGRAQQPAAVLHVAGDQLGQVALVEGARSLGGDDLEGGRQVRDDDPVLGQPAVGVVQGAPARGVPPEDAVVDVAR